MLRYLVNLTVYRWASLAMLSAIASTATGDDEIGVPSVIAACRSVDTAIARLDCYDQAVDRLQEEALAEEAEAVTSQAPQAVATGIVAAGAETAQDPVADAPLPVPDPPQQQTTVSGPDTAPQNAPTAVSLGAETENTQETPDKVVAIIESISDTGSGKLLIALENGQIWRQTGYESLQLKVGDTVEIRSASFGSFQLRKEGTKRSTRVKRVE
jgi:hypothetical protein